MLDDYLVDRRSVMKLLKDGEIGYRKIGNVYRIRKDEVIHFLGKDEGRN